MKAKLDFATKTIELETPASFEDIRTVQKCLSDWREWKIVAPTMTVTIPTVWRTDSVTYPPQESTTTWAIGKSTGNGFPPLDKHMVWMSGNAVEVQ